MRYFLLCGCLLAAAACRQTTPEAPARKTLSLQYIDSAIKPGDNFYRYANGKWLDTATVPATEAGAGARWEMSDSTKAHIHKILDDAAAAHAAAGTVTQQVGDLYLAGMDTQAIDRRGLEPVKPFLAAIDSVRDVRGLLRVAAAESRLELWSLIAIGVAADDKNSRMNIAQCYQTGLGLPDRDYYFRTDSAGLAAIAAYKKYLATLLTLGGGVDGAAQAEKVYALERKMAAAHKTQAELIDPQANYHKMAIKDLDKANPNVGWSAFIADLGASTDSIIDRQPKYYEELDKLLVQEPLEDWKLYLRAHLLDNVANYLGHDFGDASFQYYDKALSGQQKIKPRWERMYQTIDVQIGDALGQLYVQQYFPPEAKRRITELVDNLQKAFAQRIDKLDWMSDTTKQRAKAKLMAVLKKVGYPDKWRDYTRDTIRRDKYFESILSCQAENYRFNIAKLGKPVDRTEWGMTPPTNNAYYNPTNNEIVFPAGILTFPMFDVASDDALNYGGIGMVIGHEMTHGFDDQGAQYDKDGNLKDWWSPEDYKRFKDKCRRIIQLYDTFTVLDTLHVNGTVTQGENTADLGGLSIAYDAFQMTPEAKDTTRIDGFTPDQRFFMSFAQTWRKKLTDAALRRQVLTDPHSPGNWRVMGAVTNNPHFYTAFGLAAPADSTLVGIW